MPTEKLDSIQIARAVAALAVLAVHLPFVSNDIIGDRPLGMPEWLSFGYAGVDLFFVISGFIISYITYGRPFRAQSFFIRRFVRIVPMYWVFTLAWTAMAYVGGAAPPNTGSALLWSLLMWPQPSLPILSVGWSLEHELIFYGIVGFCLSLRVPLVAVMTALSTAAILIHGLLPNLTGEHLWFWHVFSLYQVQFLIGVLLYRYREWVARGPWLPMLLLGIVGFATTAHVVGHGLLIGDMSHGSLGVFRACGYGIASALVIGGLYSAECRGALTACPRGIVVIGVLLGDASYALYLSHRLLFAALGKAFAALGFGPALVVPCLIFAAASAIICAVAWFRYVEKPFLDDVRRRLAVGQRAPTS